MTTEPPASVIKPYALARQRAAWSGEIDLRDLPRFNALVAPVAAGAGRGHEAAPVVVALRFHRDEQGRSIVQGSAAVLVALDCQRCAEPVVRRLELTIDLVLVRDDDQAARLVSEREPFVLPDDHARVAELIEDDLLLALPTQVCPDFDACPQAPVLSYPAPGSMGDEPPGTRSPFHVLADLERDR